MWARLRSFARMVFGRTQWERDLRDEFECHLEERAAALEKAGLTREDARHRARIEFPRMETAKEECRDARGARWIDEISRNLTCAIRSIRQHPGFSAVAVISLALGIGANIAVFGVLHRLILTPLPVRDPAALYQIAVASSSSTSFTLSYPKFELIRDNFEIFTPLFGWGGGGWDRTVTVGQVRQTRHVVAVTGNFFDTLGIHAAVGRLIESRDQQQKISDLAVISDSLWRSAYGADPVIIGKTIDIDGQAYLIAGVTPPEFVGFEPGFPVDVYLTMHGYVRLQPNTLTGPGLQWFHTVARLKDGVSIDEARAMLRERWPALDDAIRLPFMRNSHDTLLLEPADSGFSTVRLELSIPLLVLMGLVSAVFLIACANVATLLFVRGSDRVREMSIRLALGASRPQLIRQWLTECMLLAIAGGIAGVTRWITDGLLLFVSDADRGWLRFDPNAAIGLITLGLTLAAGLACGLLPAFKVTATAPDAALRAHGGTPPRRGAMAHLVLAAQLAASLVLVVGGTMFARTLWNLNRADPGFDRRSVVYALPDFAKSSIAREQRAATVERVVERLRQSPLIDAASMGDAPMLAAGGGWSFVFDVPGYTLAANEDNTSWVNGVLPGYFETLGMRLVSGRDFTVQDRPKNRDLPRVVIINERMARHYFAGREPVGQFIRLFKADGPAVEIVGVVRDAHSATLRAQRDEYFRPSSTGAWSIVVARPSPGVSIDAVTALMQTEFVEAAKDVQVEVAPLEAAVQKTLGRDRLVARLSVVFAVLGILLATIGLYASIAHSVSSRTREIGIRIAIGAASRDVMWMVLKQGLAVVALGVAIGLPLAMLGSRLIRGLLFEVSPADPVVLGASTVMLILTGLVASAWPARRAAKLDPSQALRFE